MCGDKYYTITFIVSVVGSPPHVRGQAQRGQDVYSDAGITPACAGTSLLYAFRYKML